MLKYTIICVFYYANYHKFNYGYKEKQQQFNRRDKIF